MVCPQCSYTNEPGLARCQKCSTPLVLDDPTLTETDDETGPAQAAQDGGSGAQLAPGSLLAQRYKIIRLLGQGGMGAVYQAFDRELDRTVAVKVIRADKAGSPEAFRRFKQEIILARQITHRNVIRIFDLGQADDQKFITMEYIEGESLQRFIARRKKLEPHEAAELMVQICRALEAAHAEGVIHRDLKPQNIMRDPSGRLYVMDFGIARSIDSQMTRPGAIIGTPDYMSPEQATGLSIDQRSDIVAAGIIFYEMLSGQSPFPDENATARLWKRTNEHARSLHEIDNSIPEPLSEIVKKCLEIEPERRFANATELLQQIELWQGPPSVDATPRRVPIYLQVLIGTAVLALAALVAFKISTRPTPSHSPVSLLIADFDNKTGDPVFDGTLEPILSLALEGAPFISSYNRSDARRIASRLKPNAASLDASAAQVVALREGVNVVLAGVIAKQGSGYQVSVATLDPATGKPLLPDEGIVAANKQGVLGVTGQLADRVRRGLGDKTSSSVLQSQAETYTAGSLEAAHAYAIGQDLQQQGKWAEAIKAYDRAIGLDPDMGRAYAGAAAMWANLGQRENAEKSYQLAMARIDRMTDREKYRTRSGYYLFTRNQAKAIDELTGLLQQFPADSAGHANLAFSYFLQRDMAKALEEQRRAIAVIPRSVLQRSNLSLYALYAGDFDTAIREAQQLLIDNPKFEEGARTVGLAKLAIGHIEEAKQEYGKLQAISARGASMAITALADLALYEGRLSDAIALLEQGVAADTATKNMESLANNQITLAQTQVALGKNQEALALAAKVTAGTRDEGLLYRGAQVFIAVGQEDKALQTMAPVAKRLESGPQLYARLIAGEVQLKRGKPREAIASFQEAQKISDSWLGRFDLARAYLEAGEFDQAASEFDQCLRRRGEVTSVFLDDVPSYHFFPIIYYYQGRARQGLSHPDATESYRSFLSTREKGERDPIATDAKLRLASLTK